MANDIRMRSENVAQQIPRENGLDPYFEYNQQNISEAD